MNRKIGLLSTGLLAIALAGCSVVEGGIKATTYSEGGVKFEDRSGNGVFLSDPTISVEHNGTVKLGLVKINLEHGVASPEMLEWRFP